MSKDKKEEGKVSDKVMVEFKINDTMIPLVGEAKYSFDKDNNIILSFDIKNQGRLDKIKILFKETEYVEPIK